MDDQRTELDPTTDVAPAERIVPTQRRASEDDAPVVDAATGAEPAPRPWWPEVRGGETSAEPAGGTAPEPDPEPDAEWEWVDADSGHPEGAPWWPQVLRRVARPVGSTPPELEPVPPVRAEADTDPTDPDAAPAPLLAAPSAEDPEPRGRWGWGLVALLAVAVLVIGAVLLLNRPEGVRARAAGDVAGGPRPPAGVPEDGSLVTTRFTPTGDLEVEEWVRSATTFGEVGVRVPEVPGARVSATSISLLADGRRIDGPDSLTDAATYRFTEPARVLRLRYVLRGAVRVSRTVPTRALALVTALDVRYDGGTGPAQHRLRGATVTGVGCAPPDGSAPGACGDATPDGWDVELPGDRRTDRLTVQFTTQQPSLS